MCVFLSKGCGGGGVYVGAIDLNSKYNEVQIMSISSIRFLVCVRDEERDNERH